ncbi:MAG: hypothetical protein J5759_01010 [Bacteroidales bacterium]|nr:hypothetical protein [Bacteroidales bacterium]
MITHLTYTPPQADCSCFAYCDMLAVSGFDGDNNTEFIDYEDGGLI